MLSSTRAEVIHELPLPSVISLKEMDFKTAGSAGSILFFKNYFLNEDETVKFYSDRKKLSLENVTCNTFFNDRYNPHRVRTDITMPSKKISTLNRLFPALLSLTVLLGYSGIAGAEDVNQNAPASTEVKPGEWAYDTLNRLSAKYGCSTNLSGDRPISRDEFASSLNTCSETIEQAIALDLDRKKRRKPAIRKKRRPVAPAPVEAAPPVEEAPPVAPPPTPPEPVAPPVPEVSQQDLEQLRQLVESFKTEIQAYDAKIQALDAKAVALKEGQFSTTSKLKGEAIFAITGLQGGPTTATGRGQTIFGNRLRLNFISSFSGKDQLLTRLQARSNNSFAGAPSGTNMARLGFEGNDDNATTLHRLQYKFPLTSQTTVSLESVGSEFNDNIYNFNPEHQSAGTGSITRFGRFNPLYRLSGEGAGLTIDHKFGPGVGLSLGYAVPKEGANIPGAGAPSVASIPAPNNGLFGGSNVAFSQLAVKPSDSFNLGLIYARSYHAIGSGVSGNNGSTFANNPFGGTTPTSASHYAVLTSLDLSPDLVLSGWAGLTEARAEVAGGGRADLWNYAGTIAVKNFGSKGSTLGLVVGMPPKATTNTTAARLDPSTSLHLEAFYKYKVSDNLYITPGLLMLTNPEHNANNPTEYLGTIRTTFSF
jgi:hypothetical protein